MHNPATTADAATVATVVTASEFAILPATATRDALRIEYQWVNQALSDAPIAVFLHEGLGSIAMWREWPQQLCEQLGMRGLVYSRPGYGRSTPRPHNIIWPVDFLTIQAREILPALLDTLGVDAGQRRRMWVIGHSDGGSIALLYAALCPDQLAGAVSIAPHVFVEDISLQGIGETKAAYQKADLREKLSRYHDDVDSAFYGWSDIWLSPAFRSWSIVDTLRAIRCPLLAVQGHDDHYGTMAHIDAVAEQVPHARLAKLDACGHSPHRDAPAALNAAIVEFVEANHQD
ncbi:pimeloyl-ACP methyl ester carboxylesterase [Paraburkholderia sp. EB58]|jgi:pimeloyl-ACP methyl ester carboxylesterase|uniref:alpha/beta fold hydrolase n=1 Tax=Paraburkholderia sp. EB58 TaxID=3035125 RepID=UPI003D22EC6A